MREELQARADAAQRSISEEVEFQLQRVRDLRPLLDEIFPDPIALAMFSQMAKAVSKVRRIARRRNLDEAETRQAIGAAIDCVRDAFCYTGETQANRPSPVIGDMDKPPVHISDYEPAQMGWAVAEEGMLWDDIVLHEESSDGRISDYWTGDGSKADLAYRTILERRVASVEPLDKILSAKRRQTST
jgi:hypothetical protein